MQWLSDESHDAKHAPLNHFDYFTDIEEAFIRRRGKHLLLGPTDWSLIQAWKERGIPLPIVLRGIDKVFDACARRARQPRINSLRYCKDEVERQYKEWLSSQVGARSSGNEEAAGKVFHDDKALPFPRAAILTHLTDCRAKLLEAALRHAESQSAISEVLCSIADRLCPIVQAFTEERAPTFAEHEAALDALDVVIAEAIRDSIPPDQIVARKSEVESQFRAHCGRLSREVFERTVDSVLLRQLRDELGIPQLTLFRVRFKTSAEGSSSR